MWAGVDEVGRGPLIGSVVAAAVVLPQRHGIGGLRDSKKLSESRRERIASVIEREALAFSLAEASASEVIMLREIQVCAGQRCEAGLQGLALGCNLLGHVSRVHPARSWGK